MILHTFTTIVGTVFHLDSNNKNISSLHYSWLYMGKFSFFVLCRTVRDPRSHCMYNFTKRILYWRELVDAAIRFQNHYDYSSLERDPLCLEGSPMYAFSIILLPTSLTTCVRLNSSFNQYIKPCTISIQERIDHLEDVHPTLLRPVFPCLLSNSELAHFLIANRVGLLVILSEFDSYQF